MNLYVLFICDGHLLGLGDAIRCYKVFGTDPLELGP